jgi:hypothetical protein
MRAICFVVALCLPACGSAQGIIISGGGSSFSSSGASSSMSGSGAIPGRPVGIGNLQVTFRTDPPSTMPQRRFNSSYRGRNSPGESFFSRAFTDASNHVYFGYELILEEQSPGTYLATFGKLGLTAMEAAAGTGSSWKEWSMQVVPVPEPKVVHQGDTITIKLMTDASTGAKMFDDIQIQVFSQRLPPGVSGRVAGGVLPALAANVNRPAPTVAGPARDFSADDAELQIVQPRVTLNGSIQNPVEARLGNARGSLVWFYLPNHGRYVLSLGPRPDLDFKKAGEVRGGVITFTLGDDSIKLECTTPVATGDAPYNLYVLRDPEWEPTAQAQKGQSAVGTVAAGELLSLKRK